MLDQSASNLPLQHGRPVAEPITVLLASPRGFCAGVRRAIQAVRDALSIYGPPVYVRRPIVHNMDVVRALEAEGAVFVQELNDVPRGSVVVLSAHGVSPGIEAEAQALGLRTFDAVCPLVSKVHREVERHQRDGRQVVLIGHAGHPEVEATLGRLRSAFLVNSPEEVAALPLERDAPTAYAIQTTYSVDDAAVIETALAAQFQDLAGPRSSDICYATTNRQTAIRAIADQADAVIVVGENFSSNASRLAEVAALSCGSVQLVAGPHELDWQRLGEARTIGISAAASTPESSVESVIAALRRRSAVVVREVQSVKEETEFKPLAFA